MIADTSGFRLTGASAAALTHFDTALAQFRCYVADPVATVDRALDDSPDFVMGHLLRAYLHLLGTEPAGIPVARDAHQAATRLPATAREAGHLAAVGALVEGRWRDAGRILEDVSVDHPRDSLALQAGHLIDFYRGDSRMIRDRIARALPHWSADMPGYHALLGMHAFGLEETCDFAAAEAAGRRAVAMEPRDGWAQHAVAHVMEMTGRQADGIAWMRANPDAWSRESGLAVHNWWHVALYHLDLGDIDAVLDLFDGPIHGARSGIALELVDASAMLWRLQLRGIDVGTRWQTVADLWAPLAGTGSYAFNDVHAMMAFVGAGRAALADDVLDAQCRAMEGSSDNAMFVREVGRPVALAIRAFGAGDYTAALSLLRPVRNGAHRFGGSHAQRDLIDLTMIEAAFRAGADALAAALAAERLAVRPHSPLARLFARRADDLRLAA